MIYTTIIIAILFGHTVTAQVLAPPQLQSPADGSIGQPIELALAWNSSLSASRYRVQVSTSQSFSTISIDSSDISDTSLWVTGLAQDSVYYWRVRASNLLFVSNWSTVWNFRTIPLPPQAPVPISPSDGTTHRDVNPTLIWNTAEGATSYHLQLSPSTSFQQNLVNDSTILTTSRQVGPLVSEMEYFWRVRGINLGGAGNWSTVSRFTIAPEHLPTPILESPPDGAINIPISPMLTWNATSGQVTYRIQVSTQNDFLSLIKDQSGIESTSYVANGLSPGTNYFWRVNASNASDTTKWSSVWSFTTISELPPPPTLIAPPDGTTDQQDSLTVRWNPTPGALRYHLQLATRQDFSALIVDDSLITSTSFYLDQLHDNTRYYWRVRGKNASGYSNWSAAWTFVTEAMLPPPSTPILISPSQSAIDQETTLRFIWQTVEGTVTYRFQLSTDAAFTSPEHDLLGLTDTSFQITQLSNNTTYYWRVNANNSSGTGNWSAVWSFATKPAVSLSAPILSSPNDGEINLSLALQLHWQTVLQATSYQAQVDINPNFISPFINQPGIPTPALSISGLSNSTAYYWRVRALNDTTVSAWSIVRTFTTIPSPPQPPILSSPPSGATSQSLTLILSWEHASGTEHYHVQISLAPDFQTVVANDTSVTGNSRQVGPLTPNTRYYWRVRGVNAGGIGQWSTVYNLTTGPGNPIPPSDPVLASPPENATNQPTTIVLQWHPSTGATAYRIQVSLINTFSSLTHDVTGIQDTSEQVGSLSDNTKYYWRALASNTTGTSNWSSPRAFTTSSPVPIDSPTLVSPSNGATHQPTSVILSWNGVLTATSYQVQVSTSSTFTSTVLNESGITATSHTASSLVNGTTYYWRVRASTLTLTGPWSAVWSFTTTSPPGPAPLLSSPANGASNQPLTVVLNWNSVAGANFYHVQVSTSTSFGTFIVNDSSVNTTSRQIGPLLSNREYYWRIRGITASGPGNWSSIWNFTTISAPSAPQPISPANGATNQPLLPELTWSFSAGSDRYRLQLSSSSTFAVLIVNDSTITGLSKQVGPLTSSQQYHWRVRGINSVGSGDWSPIFNFTTGSSGIGPPSVPILVSPSNNATNQSTSLVLKWSPSINATAYRIQVSTNTLFSPLVYDITSIIDTTQLIEPLANSTRYYWRVMATNSSGNSNWSTMRSFQTSPSGSIGTPSLTSPPNGATNQPLTNTLTWSQVTGATSYQVQVSVEPSFTSVMIDQSGLTTTSYGISGLSIGTTYYWRVRAVVVALAGPWSGTWMFSTFSQQSSAPILTSPENGAVTTQFPLQLLWESVNGAVVYQAQVSTFASFTPSLLSDSMLPSPSYTIDTLNQNTSYYWRVRAKTSAGWSPYSPSWTFTTGSGSPSTVTVATTIHFPEYPNRSDYSVADYKIVGLPGASNYPVQTLLPGNAGIDWQMYWDRGTPNDFMVSYLNSPDFEFSEGRGFWLIKKGVWTLNEEVPAAQLNSNQEAEIPLHDGWNLITNPFAHSIPWSQIQSLNTISEPIFGFNGGFQVGVNFAPYEGYYFFNTDGRPTLLIPSTQGENSQALSLHHVESTVKENVWTVHIELAVDGSSDNMNIIGVNAKALDEFDSMDLRKPRTISLTQPEVSFERPGWDSRYPNFSSDIRSSIGTGATWRFNITSIPGKEAQLTFHGIDQIPSAYQVRLIDNIRLVHVNLRNDSVYTFMSYPGKSDYCLVVGTDDYMKDILREIPLPGEFVLEENFPNPFNPSTVIPVLVPISTDLTLKVFDMLGKEVRQLFNGYLDQGRHLFEWDGRDNNGQIVANGMYFSRITTLSGINKTNKMLLVK